MLIIVPVNSFSNEISNEEMYQRCYIRMARKVLDLNDSLFLEVKSRKKTAADACIELFDKAQFNSSGVLTNRNDPVAKSILRTFHELHHSWFQIKTHTFQVASYLVRDNDEPALYFTRAAFLPNAKFSSVLTHSGGLAGVRDQIGYPNEANRFKSQRILSYGSGYPYANELDLILAYNHIEHNGEKYISSGAKSLRIPANQITEVGELVGVKSSENIRLPSFRFNSSGIAEVVEAVKPTMTNFNANTHFGGGVLGSQSFLLNNTNLTSNQLPNDYSIISRRTTNRIFEDILCHELPSLTDEDVLAEVKINSEHGFQRTTSCMRCHSSMDGMALGLRNYAVYTSAANPSLQTQTVGVNFSGIAKLTPKSGAKTFAVQPPTGSLHYRELLSKNRYKQTFRSLGELGNLLSQQNDFYTCAAKRYYRFFTGINVDLSKRAENELDRHHQEVVVSLGQQLKTQQSVRSLLYGVFTSEAFRRRNYMSEERK